MSSSLLKQNLQQEQKALKKLQTIGKRLAKEGASTRPPERCWRPGRLMLARPPAR